MLTIIPLLAPLKGRWLARATAGRGPRRKSVAVELGVPCATVISYDS